MKITSTSNRATDNETGPVAAVGRVRPDGAAAAPVSDRRSVSRQRGVTIKRGDVQPDKRSPRDDDQRKPRSA